MDVMAGMKDRLFGTAPEKVFAPILALAIGLLIALGQVDRSAALLGISAIVLLSLVQPLVALALALFVGPFGALENAIVGGLAIDSGQLLLLLAIATWIGQGLLRRQLDLPKTALTVPLLVFIAAGCISLIGAPDPLLGVVEVVKWVEITAVMLMVTDLGRQLGTGSRGKDLKMHPPGQSGISWMTAALLLSGALQGIIGIWQFALREDGPEHFLVLGRFYRAYGTFEQPNPYGGFMNMTALLAIGVLIGLLAKQMSMAKGERASQRQTQNWLLSLLPIFAVTGVAMVALLGLLFSWSRGAWMGFAAGIIVMVLFLPRRVWRGFIALAIIIMLIVVVAQAGLLPATFAQRIGGFASSLSFGDVRGVDINDANYAVLERLAHWQAAIDMVRDHLWLGVGFGNYGTAYPIYALINWPDALGHAHNYYLNVLAEMGILGLLAYVFLWGAIILQTVRALRWQEWPVRGLLLGLLGVWTAFSVHHLVDKLYVNNLYIHLGVLLGLLQLGSLQGPARTSLDYSRKRKKDVRYNDAGVGPHRGESEGS